MLIILSTWPRAIKSTFVVAETFIFIDHFFAPFFVVLVVVVDHVRCMAVETGVEMTHPSHPRVWFAAALGMMNTAHSL